MVEIVDIPRRCVDDYFVASSMDEAIGYLTANSGHARVIGGGTWLMPVVQRGESRATSLVDVSRIAYMRRLTEDGPWIVLGGACTFARLMESELVRARVPLLYQAARAMGTPGVRRLATLAGNVVCAAGNAQGALALLTLDAEAEIANLTGSQWLPLHTLFVRSGVSRVNVTSEIVTGFRARGAGGRDGFALTQQPPVAPRQRAPMIAAVSVGLSENGQTIASAAVAAGWEGGIPLRLPLIEQALIGSMAGAAVTEEGLLAALGDVPIGAAPENSPDRERRAQIARLAALAIPRAVAQAASRLATPPA